MRYHCYSSGSRRTCRRPRFLALEEPIGQFASIQRSPLLWHVGLEQWPINFIYSHPRRQRQGLKLTYSPRNAVTEPIQFLSTALSVISGTLASALDTGQSF